MNAVDIAWLAGIIEGEGTILIPQNAGRHYPSVRVRMTDKDIIYGLQSITGMGNVILGEKPKEDHYKQSWQWHVCKRQDVARLLLAIVPLMGERRTARILEAAEALARNYRKRIVASCGTRSGYNRHRRLNEVVCDGCREAVRVTTRRRVAAEQQKRIHTIQESVL